MELIISLGALVVAIWGGILARRIQKAASADIPDDRCVSCDSMDITQIGHNAYECNTCGYEGGSGLKATQDSQRLDFVRNMNYQQRRQWSQQNYQNARTLLLSSAGDINAARQYSRRGKVNEEQKEINNALGLLAEAQKLIQDAEYGLFLAKENSNTGNNVDIDYATWINDVQYDFIFTDLKKHLGIRKQNKLIKETAEYVNQRLAEFAD